MFALLISPLVLLIALAFGHRILTLLRFKFTGRLEPMVFSSFTGLAMIANLVFLLGIAGRLYFWMLLFLLAAIILISLPSVIHGIRLIPKIRWNVPRPNIFWLAILALAVLGLAVSYVATFAPPISTDELTHHLALPKVYLREHALAYRPFHVFSVLPSLAEMLYTLGLAFEGAASSKQFHWILGLLGCLATTLWAKRFVPGPWNWLAGAFLLLTPGINNQMCLAHNDVALTAFVVMGFWSTFTGIEQKEFRWFLLAGFFFGSALGVKYTAGPSLIAAGTVVILAAMLKKIPVRVCFTGLIALSVTTILSGGFWYLRSYLHTGNPVFPFFHDLFTGKADDLLVFFKSEHHGLGKSFLDLVLLPWNLTMHQEAFGGWGNQLGPLFLAVIPGAILVRKWNRNFWLITIAAIEITLIWFFLKQNTRFLFPAVPLFCILAAYIVWEFQALGPFACRLIPFLCAVLLAVQTAVLVFNKREFYPVALGLKNKNIFLGEHVEGYAMSGFVNRNLPGSAKILTNEMREFYFTPVLERHGGYYWKYAKIAKNEEALYDLMKRDGFTHLLWKESLTGPKTKKWLPDKMIASEKSRTLGLRKIYESISPNKRLKHTLYEL